MPAMTKKRMRAWEQRQQAQRTQWTAADVGLDPARHQQMLRHVFDRASSDRDDESLTLDATPLEWTRFQTVLFSNAQADLADFDDDQVGAGLRHLMDNGHSDVPYAAIDASVPLPESMRMMAAMPGLWRGVFGPRLAQVHRRIGTGGDLLGSSCYMWFDVWPTFHLARGVPEWRDAMWRLLSQLLAMPWREVRVSALHGIGHAVHYLDCQPAIDHAIDEFLRQIDPADEDLRTYAEAARVGRVQ
jgi:hypothetical protein